MLRLKVESNNPKQEKSFLSSDPQVDSAKRNHFHVLYHVRDEYLPRLEIILE